MLGNAPFLRNAATSFHTVAVDATPISLAIVSMLGFLPACILKRWINSNT